MDKIKRSIKISGIIGTVAGAATIIWIAISIYIYYKDEISAPPPALTSLSTNDTVAYKIFFSGVVDNFDKYYDRNHPNLKYHLDIWNEGRYIYSYDTNKYGGIDRHMIGLAGSHSNHYSDKYDAFTNRSPIIQFIVTINNVDKSEGLFEIELKRKSFGIGNNIDIIPIDTLILKGDESRRIKMDDYADTLFYNNWIDSIIVRTSNDKNKILEFKKSGKY